MSGSLGILAAVPSPRRLDGTVEILEPPADDGLAPGDLAPGERHDGILEGTIDAPPDQVFVTFTDAGDVLRLAVPVA